jgi:CubicO group peptidase (beta-lactamase class C family)
MKRIIITIVVCIHAYHQSQAQSSDSLHAKTLSEFISTYNDRQYDKMRDLFGGPLKLIFTEKRLEQLYGGMHEQLGSGRITSAKWRQTSVKAAIVYERDTTEYIESGFSFSKKSKIIGLGNSSPKYKYVKKTPEPMNQADFTRIDSLIEYKHHAAAFSGCVAIIEDDKVVYESCKGKMIYPDGPELTSHTPFEIASCSKAFTAAMIAILEQQGKLKYSDDITAHIPELKKYKGITIEQLIHHTSGLPDYMELFETYWNKTKIAGNEDVVKLLAEKQPKRSFKPGEEFEYSNTGYVMLAVIAERVTGMPFKELMDKELFSKAGFETAFLNNYRRAENTVRPNYAYGHIYDFRKKTNQQPDSIPSYDYVYYLDGITGDGMVNISVHDMLHWDKILREPGLLSASSIERIFTSGKTNKGELTNYGFGWDLGGKEDSEKIAEHSGSWPGYATYVLRFIDHPRTIIIFSNNEYLFLSQMAHSIAKIIH